MIAGLARAIPGDIAGAGEAVRHARRGRIHTFVSTSPIHLAHPDAQGEAEVLEIITATVTQARNLVEDVEVVGDGRDASPDRLSVQMRGDRDRGRCHHAKPAGHRRHMRCRTNTGGCSKPFASGCRTPVRRSSRCTVMTIWVSPSPTRWPASRAARARWIHHQRHRQSGRAMPRWKKS